MVEFDYLRKGLNALARAHRVNTMAGHLGAAVVAGYFISEQHPDLDDAVALGVSRELDRVIKGGSVFSPRPGASISAQEMFEPFPKERGDEKLIGDIAEALAGNIDRARQSGHNVIFASIAIRALKDHPDFATPAVAGGIRKLIAAFNGKTPGNGYYGKGKGRIDGRKIKLREDDGIAPYADLAGMANTTFDQLIAHAKEHRQGYGGLWHVINHGAALAELAAHGYRDLATQGLPAHREHLRLWKTVPDVSAELGAEKAAPHDPRDAEYWADDENLRRDRALLTHRVKTIYGFDTLAEWVGDKGKRERANAALRYLM